MSHLVVEDLHVRYGSVHAVRGVDLAVGEGQVVGILGANGAGKSSLVNAVLGMQAPAAGRVSLGGVEITGCSVRRHVRAGLALSPEGRGVLPGLSVREHLELGMYSSGRLSGPERARRTKEVFDLFPVLGERSEQDAQTLSGGEAAMLSVGRAMISAPKVLLLDEPTLGLAPVMSERLFAGIEQLKSNGMSMVIVEQRATELFRVADQLLQMRQGRATLIEDVGALDSEALGRLYFGEGVAAK